jgi:transcription elongation factor
MNVHVNSMAPAAAATPIDWAEVLNGVARGGAGLVEASSTLVHQLHYLLGDLESGLDLGRARAIDGDTVTLMFQKDGIEATLWLLSEAWRTAKNMQEALKALQDQMDEAGE